jgi:hypothetical protein
MSSSINISFFITAFLWIASIVKPHFIRTFYDALFFWKRLPITLQNRIFSMRNLLGGLYPKLLLICSCAILKANILFQQFQG